MKALSFGESLVGPAKICTPYRTSEEAVEEAFPTEELPEELPTDALPVETLLPEELPAAELPAEEVPEELPALQEMVLKEMEGAYSGKVALTASSGAASNWLDAH